MLFQIKHRWTQQVLFEVEAEDLRAAAVAAVAGGADLRGASLRGADLGGASLRGAYLSGASLRGADLRGAYLSGANLRGAYLSGASLHGADLRGANLRGANLRGADLGGAKMPWQSHDILAEVLRRAAGDDVPKLKIAGLILVRTDWCWKDFLGLDDPLRDWALESLAEYVQDGGEAPEVLRRIADRRPPVAAVGSAAAD
jgi:uncharacterized protein YjbI with pentapeptide repeats